MRTYFYSLAPKQPRLSTTVMLMQLWDTAAIALFSALAFAFPLVAGLNRIEANVFKYDLLVAASLLCGGLLLREIVNSPNLNCLLNNNRLGLAVSAILGVYTLLLCGPVLEAMLVAVFVPSLFLSFRAQMRDAPDRAKGVFWLLCGFSASVVASCFFSLHQYVAIVGSPYYRTGLSMFLSCLMLFLGAYRLIRDRDRALRILHLLLLSGFVVGGIAMAQFFLPNGFISDVFPSKQYDARPYSTLGHPNWFGTYLLLLLPFAIAFVLDQPRRWMWWGLIALLHADLLICQTRGAWVAEAVLICAIAVGRRRQWRRLAGLFGILCVVTLLLLPAKDWQILKRAGTMSEEVDLAVKGASNTGSDRFFYWSYALRHLPNHLVIGSGLDTFKEVANPGERVPYGKAHSIYLEYASTMGLAGLGLYLLFLWRVFWTASPSWCGWAFRWMLIAYLVQSVFIHDTIQTWPLLWLLAGLAVGPLAQSEEPTALVAASDSTAGGTAKPALARSELIGHGQL